MGFVRLPPPKITSKNGFTPIEPDTFNPKAVEWCSPVAKFWMMIVDAENQEQLDKVLWEADRALAEQPEGGPKKSCEKYLKAAYKTHLWRIRHGTKTFG